LLSRICTDCDVWNYINGFYLNMLFNKIFGSNASKPWSKSQAKRLGALNKFKAGECNILVCTDVASRGLDIPLVGLVINYNIPPNLKVYIHRVGRTARAGRTGVAISFVTQYEWEWYLQIEEHTGKKLRSFPAPEEEVLLLMERVSEVLERAICHQEEELQGLNQEKVNQREQLR
ncbi:hypothetical protein C3L33_23528, partial [Rhododendron williamsianum]